MLNDIQALAANEPNVPMDHREQLLCMRRRYTNLAKKIAKQRKRAERAAQLRESYWTHRSSLETCLEDCRREMTSCAGSDTDASSRVAQLEVLPFVLFCAA